MLNNRLDNIPKITRSLLLINIFVWMACCVFGRMGLIEILGLHYVQAKNFFLYQLITYMFTHEAFMHLFFNLFALFMFGGALESIWGQKRFLTYYLITGVGAGLVHLVVLYIKIHYEIDRLKLDSMELSQIYDSISIAIGASGAIFGLLLAFGMLFPEAPVYFMFIPIPIKAKYFVTGYGMIEFLYGISDRVGDNVAHFAHLGGMLFGICMILYWKRRK